MGSFGGSSRKRIRKLQKLSLWPLCPVIERPLLAINRGHKLSIKNGRVQVPTLHVRGAMHIGASMNEREDITVIIILIVCSATHAAYFVMIRN